MLASRQRCYAFDSAGHYSSSKNFSNYDPEFLSESKSHAAQARTIYDVGANIGLYSLAAVCCNPEVEVYPFEPEPHLASLLGNNTERNSVSGCRKCVSVRQMVRTSW